MDEKTSPLTKVLGGVEIEVHFNPVVEGVAPESPQRIKVRKLPLKLMLNYLIVMNDHDKMVELFCDKPPGWCESLTDESQLAILKAGQELNLPLFESWYPLHLAKSVALRPAMIKEIEDNAVATVRAILNNGSGSTPSAPPSSREPAGATPS